MSERATIRILRRVTIRLSEEPLSGFCEEPLSELSKIRILRRGAIGICYEPLPGLSSLLVFVFPSGFSSLFMARCTITGILEDIVMGSPPSSRHACLMGSPPSSRGNCNRVVIIPFEDRLLAIIQFAGSSRSSSSFHGAHERLAVRSQES